MLQMLMQQDDFVAIGVLGVEETLGDLLGEGVIGRATEEDEVRIEAQGKFPNRTNETVGGPTLGGTVFGAGVDADNGARIVRGQTKL